MQPTIERINRPMALRGVKALAGMELLRRGSRLSVQPVTAFQFRTIVALASKRPAARP